MLNENEGFKHKPTSTSRMIRHRHLTIMNELKEMKTHINTQCWWITHNETSLTGFHILVEFPR